MNKSDLIHNLGVSCPHLTHEEISKSIDIVFRLITKAIAEGNRVEVRGFGTISTRERIINTEVAKSDPNKQNRRKKNVVYYRASKNLLDNINNGT